MTCTCMAQRKVSVVRHLRSRRGRSSCGDFWLARAGAPRPARTAYIRASRSASLGAAQRHDISRTGHNLFNLSEVELHVQTLAGISC